MKPHEYDRLDHKSGKVVREFSPRFCRNMMLVGLGFLAFVIWHRAEIEPDIFTGLTLLLAFGSGGMFTAWLRHSY